MNSRILEIDREKHPFEDVLLANPTPKKRLPPRAPGEPLVVVDLFCGAGGTSSGVVRALQSTGRKIQIVGVNHWERAVDTMRMNFPGISVHNASVAEVRPDYAVPGGRIDLLVASPECVMHSTARGNKPIYDQSRSSAAFIYEWLANPNVYVDAFCLENVPEWSRWSVLDENLQPVKGREGEYFDSFLHQIRLLGYTLDYRVLNAADYGDATSRRRLFVVGSQNGQSVLFPEPTHAENPKRVRGEKKLKKWRSAREIIDWDVRGQSIFNRDKGPHSPKSLKRMRGGFAKQETPLASAYVEAIDRFIPIAEAFHREAKRAEYLHSSETKEGRKARKAAKDALVAEARAALFEAFQTPVGQYDPADLQKTIDNFVIANRNNAAGRTDGPIPVITTGHDGGIASVSSMILGQNGNAAARDMSKPVPTIATAGAVGKFDGTLIDATLVKMTASDKSSFDDATRSPDRPLPTILPKDCTGIAVPVGLEGFVFPVNHGGEDDRTQSYDETLGTLTTRRSHGKSDPVIIPPAEAFLSPLYGEKDGHARANRDLDDPVPAITATQRHSLVSPALETPETTFILPQRGDTTAATTDPVPTVVTIARIGLVAGTQPEAFIAEQRGFFGDDKLGYASRGLEEPLSAITSHTNHHALIDPTLTPEPFVSHLRGYFGDERIERASSDTSEPLDTIAASGNHHGLVESEVVPSTTGVDGFITANFGERPGQSARVGSLDDPTWVATGRGAGNLITPDLQTPVASFPSSIRPFIMIGEMTYQLDILFRMLNNSELSKAMSFSDGKVAYKFSGSTADVTRQIGNAVPVRLATALVSTILRYYIDPKSRKKGRIHLTIPEPQVAA